MINNSIGELIVIVIFTIIIFQLSVIYRRTYSVGELTVAMIFPVIPFQLSRIY